MTDGPKILGVTPKGGMMDAEHYDGCSDCERAQTDYANLERVTEDLVALVCRLADSLRKAAPDNDLPKKALDYLKRKDLLGSPLRDDAVLPNNI